MWHTMFGLVDNAFRQCLLSLEHRSRTFWISWISRCIGYRFRFIIARCIIYASAVFAVCPSVCLIFTRVLCDKTKNLLPISWYHNERAIPVFVRLQFRWCCTRQRNVGLLLLRIVCLSCVYNANVLWQNHWSQERVVFTTKQLDASAFRLISGMTKFEGIPRLGGAQLCWGVSDFASLHLGNRTSRATPQLTANRNSYGF